MIKHPTWRRKGGLAMWNYYLWPPSAAEETIRLLSDAKQRKNWLARRVCRAIYALSGFARAEEASIWTLSEGEDTYVINLRAKGGLPSLERILRCTADMTDVQLSLTLLISELTPSGERLEIEIDGGADLCLYIELDEESELDTSLEPAIWLMLSLDVDIYAPISWGERRDNANLAALNSPRLSGFLQRLERDMPAELMSIDADDYQGMIGRHGFVAPKKKSFSNSSVRSLLPPLASHPIIPNIHSGINVRDQRKYISNALLRNED